MSKAFFNIQELAAMLGFTVSAIHSHLYRKNFDAVPPPIHLGRRLAWPTESTEAWVRQRIEAATRQLPEPDASKRHVGRPTKAESRAQRKKLGLE